MAARRTMSTTTKKKCKSNFFSHTRARENLFYDVSQEFSKWDNNNNNHLFCVKIEIYIYIYYCTRRVQKNGCMQSKNHSNWAYAVGFEKDQLLASRSSSMERNNRYLINIE